jgi:hypothetical protein
MQSYGAKEAPMAFREEVEGYDMYFDVRLPKAVVQLDTGPARQQAGDFMLWKFRKAAAPQAARQESVS